MTEALLGTVSHLTIALIARGGFFEIARRPVGYRRICAPGVRPKRLTPATLRSVMKESLKYDIDTEKSRSDLCECEFSDGFELRLVQRCNQ